jgi:hypothetical protein
MEGGFGIGIMVRGEYVVVLAMIGTILEVG